MEVKIRKTQYAKRKTIDVKRRMTKKGLFAPMFSKTGAKKGTVLLSRAVFGQKVNKTLLAQAIRVYLSNQRRARAKAKTRGQVRISKAKIWRQKGTGRARHGARSAPIFVGGGVAHGPTGEQNFRLILPKKLKKQALIFALSAKALEKKVMVADIENVEPKTKVLAGFLAKIGVGPKDKTTIVYSDSKSLRRAGGNIENVLLVGAEVVNVYSVASAGRVLLTKEALPQLEARVKVEQR